MSATLLALALGHDCGETPRGNFWIAVVQNSYLAGAISNDTRQKLIGFVLETYF